MQHINDEVIKSLYSLEKSQDLAKQLSLTINLSKEKEIIEVIDKNNSVIYWNSDPNCIKAFLKGIKYNVNITKNQTED